MKRLLISVFGLLIFFALALQTAKVKSPTSDEGMHLLRGKVLWQTGELNLQGQHTPLSHWLIGSLISTEPTAADVTSLPSWYTQSAEGLVREFLWESGADVSRLVLLGRLPIIFAGLIIGALLARWSSLKAGIWGLYVVMILFAFSPNLLASSTLSTTDVVAAATFLASLFSLWAFWQRPSLSRWLVASVLLGLALGSKLTGVILLPITLLLCYFHWRGRPWWQPGLIWLCMLPVAGVVLWALYGFEIGSVGAIPFAIPAPTYASNFLEVYEHIDLGHYAYLLGERSNEGWWHYFGVAFLVKTPAVTIILLSVAVIVLIRGNKWRRTLFLWVPALVLFVAASYSRLNIGYRHILPIVPLLWLIIAESTPWWRQRRSLRAILLLLLAIYAAIGLVQAPDYLAYFNEFAGGSSRGYRILGDSNVDWGQDLNLLAEFVANNEDPSLYVSYAGAADPAYYGLDAPGLFDDEGKPRNFNPANPSAGRYAISVNHLQSASNHEPDLFDWFRNHQPTDTIGYSILIYDVGSPDDGDWVAHCIDPEPALDQATVGQYVGIDINRHIYFDCRSSWVIPAGHEPGWYVLPEDFDPGFLSEILERDLQLVYTNRYSETSQPYKIYYLPAPEETVTQLIEQASEATLGPEDSLIPPLSAGDIVKFQGGWARDSLWATLWQAEHATEQPLSVLLHLHSIDQQVIVADGLGFAPVQWQPGDLFIQYNDFEMLTGRYLETGLYNYITEEHLEIQTSAGDISTIRITP